MAYVTYSGVAAVFKQLQACGCDVTAFASEWIIGIHNGITEPRALTELSNKPRAKVLIFSPNGEVSRNAMVISPRLHAKIVAVDGGGETIVSLLAGSANLTGAAVGTPTHNYEAGIILPDAAAAGAADHVTFNRWWRALRRYGIKANRQIIGKYAAARRSFLSQTRKAIDLIDLDPPTLDELRAARFFWIEAGDMSGGNVPEYRYQMELNGTLVQFFRARRPVTRFQLIMPNGDKEQASLTFRQKYHFVGLWRLGLPHPKRFGLQYRNNLLRFERLQAGVYRLAVADLGSREAKRWRDAANEEGRLGRTGTTATKHGREWGHYREIHFT